MSEPDQTSEPETGAVTEAPADPPDAEAGSDGAPQEQAEVRVVRRRRPGRRVLLALAVVIVAFVGGLAVWPLLAPRLGLSIVETLLGEALLARLDKVEARLDAVEAAAKAPDPAAADLRAAAERSSKRIAALENRLSGLETADPGKRIAAVQDRLAALEGQTGGLAAADTVAGLDRRLAGLERAIAAVPIDAGSAALASQLETIDARLAALEARPPVPGEGVAPDPALADRLEALERALAEAREAAAANRAGLDALGARTERLDAGLAAQGERLAAAENRAPATAAPGAPPAAALVLAVGQLRAALATAAPFEPELAALDALGGGEDAGDPDLRAAIAALRPIAPAGAATPGELRSRFGAVAGRVARAALRPGGDWLARTLGRLTTLVTVRRTGEVAGAAPDAVMARAERRLAAGDLAAAVREVAALEGAAAAAAAEWLAAAERRLAAEQALTTLHGLALARLDSSERTIR